MIKKPLSIPTFRALLYCQDFTSQHAYQGCQIMKLAFEEKNKNRKPSNLFTQQKT